MSEARDALMAMGLQEDPHGNWVVCHDVGNTGIAVLAEDLKRNPAKEVAAAPARIADMRAGYRAMNTALDEWMGESE